MIAYPLIVVIVNGAFGGVVLRQFLVRRRPHQLVWTVALLLGFLAGAFYVLFLAFGDNSVLFRLYYICGALLMAAYLGLGSIYLLAPRRVADLTAAALVVLSLIGIILLLMAGIDHGKLVHAAHVVGPGTSALKPGGWKAMVAILNIFGSLAVVGGAIYSGWLTYRRHSPITFLYANVLIAAGTFLAALAGGVADQGAFAGSFWIILAAGFVVLFAGFLLTTRRPRVSSAPTESKAEQVEA
ncbi:MAG TPA: hypothetical protein VFB34_05245 [Chloroflexota bacterium]|nr:hypothetical protein [Chloroflexota bacterium]